MPFLLDCRYTRWTMADAMTSYVQGSSRRCARQFVYTSTPSATVISIWGRMTGENDWWHGMEKMVPASQKSALAAADDVI